MYIEALLPVTIELGTCTYMYILFFLHCPQAMMLFADRLKETAKLIVIVKSMTNDKHEKVHLSSPLLSSLSPSAPPLPIPSLFLLCLTIIIACR